MAKGQWHITKTGQVRKCTADKKPCPYGGVEDGRHADTKEDAIKLAEKVMQKEHGNGLTGVSKKNKKNADDGSPLGFFPKSVSENIDEMMSNEDNFYFKDDNYDPVKIKPLLRIKTIKKLSDNLSFMDNYEKYERFELYKKKLMEDLKRNPEYALYKNALYPQFTDSDSDELRKSINVEDIPSDEDLMKDIEESVRNNDDTDEKKQKKLNNMRMTLQYSETAMQLSEKLSTRDYNALAMWTGGGSNIVGKHLHKDGSGRNYNSKFFQTDNPKNKDTYFDVKNYLNTLDDVIDRNGDLDEPVQVYRGVPEETFGKDYQDMMFNDPEKASKRVEEMFKVGSTVSFDTPSSTTLSKDLSERFAAGSQVIYRFNNVRKGVPIGATSAWGYGEYEYLLPRNKEYKVMKVSKSPSETYSGKPVDITFIDLEEE